MPDIATIRRATTDDAAALAELGAARSAVLACSLAPLRSVRNGARAVEFYKSAFGAVEVYRVEDPSGAVVPRLSIDSAQCSHLLLEPSQIGQQRRPLFRLRRTIEIHTICGCDRRNDARRRVDLDSFEKLDVVIDDLF